MDRPIIDTIFMSCSDNKNGLVTLTQTHSTQTIPPLSHIEPYLVSVLQQLPALVAVIDGNGRVIFHSQQFTELEQVSSNVDDIHVLDDLFPITLRSHVHQFLLANNPTMNFWDMAVSHKNGELNVYQMRKLELPSNAASPAWLLWGANITQSVEFENVLRDHKSQIAYLTYHDPLTGLANRT